jgi:hypothetical protein
MAGARAYLLSRGVSIPDKILLTGGSYGGYLTLQGLGVRPELWAGGMGVVAIADCAPPTACQLSILYEPYRRKVVADTLLAGRGDDVRG